MVIIWSMCVLVTQPTGWALIWRQELLARLLISKKPTKFWNGVAGRCVPILVLEIATARKSVCWGWLFVLGLKSIVRHSCHPTPCCQDVIYMDELHFLFKVACSCDMKAPSAHFLQEFFILISNANPCHRKHLLAGNYLWSILDAMKFLINLSLRWVADCWRFWAHIKSKADTLSGKKW